MLTRTEALALIPQIQAETGSPALGLLVKELLLEQNPFILNAESRTEVVITTNVITPQESGTTFFLALAGGFTSTLPLPAAGLRYTFIVKVAPTTAYIIKSSGDTNIIAVTVNELETDTADDGPYDDNADTVNFVADLAAVGDFLDFWCDGTLWYARGQTNLDGAVTTATT